MSDNFDEIYRFLRLQHYQTLFGAINEKAGSLSATEAFSVEVIYLLGQPTLGEFAQFIGISQPNASYKVAALVAKGYITKEPAPEDRRECLLVVTPKFRDYYGTQKPDLMSFIAQLSPDEIAVLQTLSRRLSAEIPGIIRSK